MGIDNTYTQLQSIYREQFRRVAKEYGLAFKELLPEEQFRIIRQVGADLEGLQDPIGRAQDYIRQAQKIAKRSNWQTLDELRRRELLEQGD